MSEHAAANSHVFKNKIWKASLCSPAARPARFSSRQDRPARPGPPQAQPGPPGPARLRPYLVHFPHAGSRSGSLQLVSQAADGLPSRLVIRVARCLHDADDSVSLRRVRANRPGSLHLNV